MTVMTISEARANLAQVVDTARVNHEPVSLTKHGKRVAVVLGEDEYQRLLDSAASPVVFGKESFIPNAALRERIAEADAAYARSEVEFMDSVEDIDRMFAELPEPDRAD
jgi:prevent-host-death family protein